MSGWKSLRNVIVVGAVIAVVGLVRMPIEQKFTADLRERKIIPPRIDSEVWSQMGQTSLAGAFGGLRTVMASLMSLRAYSRFENNEWYEIKRDYEIITAFDPYNAFYWDNGGWHLGYNAASWARTNPDFSPVRRRAMEMKYLEQGDAFYREGLKYLPEEDKLWFELGAMWSNEYKRPDLERAAEAFKMVRRSPNPVYRRRYLITIAKIPGKEMEAYEEVMRLLREEAMTHLKTPTFRCLLLVLSSNPNLPADALRPRVEQVYQTKEKAYQDLYNYRLRAKREGFYEGRLDDMLQELIRELNVPDPLNPFITPRSRPITGNNWREQYERGQSKKAGGGLPDWIFKKPREKSGR